MPNNCYECGEVGARARCDVCHERVHSRCSKIRDDKRVCETCLISYEQRRKHEVNQLHSGHGQEGPGR